MTTSEMDPTTNQQPFQTRAELFRGADVISHQSDYEEAYEAGLDSIYYGRGRADLYQLPDGRTFTWESEISGFGQVATVTLYDIEGRPTYTMTTRADSNGWHDEPWQPVEGEVVDDKKGS